MAEVTVETEGKIAEFVGSFYDDPYGFVMGIFPWGDELLPDGSPNPLKDKKGPEPWQRDLLVDLGKHIKNNNVLRVIGLDMEVWKSAVASGHGVGKSAIVAWLIMFMMSTRVDTRGGVTANTQFQLEDKTWPELSKWHSLALNSHWFEWTATGFVFAQYPKEKQKNYKTTAATVSKDNTEALAGLHNEGKTVFIIFDEASGIDAKIWEVSEGALTDGEGFFFSFGNPTRPDGEFADCFDKHAHLYWHRQVDSREVSHTNKQALQGIIDKYGDDSDEVKVRIKGQFPNQSFNGFISVDIARTAMERDTFGDPGAALIMAVDVARFGNDRSVIGFRQGRDARSIPMQSFKGLDTVKLVKAISLLADKYRPDAIVIESTGPGAGVIDMLRDRGYKIIEVHPQAQRKELYFNVRAENWSLMRDWLYEEGCVPEDPLLFKELTSILYTMDRNDQKILLEPKPDMKKRGLPSPDIADMLSLTFAVRIARRDRTNTLASGRKTSYITEYDELLH